MADVPAAGAYAYLQTQAIARLYLDNIPNIQSSWVTPGAEDRAIGPVFRRQRHGQPNDRGKPSSPPPARCITYRWSKSKMPSAKPAIFRASPQRVYEYLDEQSEKPLPVIPLGKRELPMTLV